MSASGNYIVESDVNNWPVAVSSTETFATTAVSVADNKITIATNVLTGSLINFSSTDTLPAPLVESVNYYAIKIDSTHIKVASTPVLAAAGTALILTTVGVGTHTLNVGEGSSTADRQETIDNAEDLIEKLTKDFFYAKSFIIYLDGNGKDYLDLGQIPAILSVTEIKIAGIVLSADWYTYNSEAVYLDPDYVGGDIDDPELLLRIKYSMGLFSKGIQNIKVTGTYGHTTCPAAIKRAAIILCKADNDSSLYPSHDFALSSESLGDYSYSVNTEVKNVSCGIPAVDALLKHYIKKKIFFSAI